MDKLTNRACARYLRRVRRLLPCARKEKDRITATLYESLEGFSAEKPEAREADVLERFGTPETVADSCLENMETKGVLNRLQSIRRLRYVAAAVALIVLLSWGGVLLSTYLDYHNYYNGYEREYITVDKDRQD